MVDGEIVLCDESFCVIPAGFSAKRSGRIRHLCGGKRGSDKLGFPIKAFGNDKN